MNSSPPLALIRWTCQGSGYERSTLHACDRDCMAVVDALKCLIRLCVMRSSHHIRHAVWHGKQLSAEGTASTSSCSGQLASAMVTLSMSQETGLHASRPPWSHERGTHVRLRSLQYLISRDALLPEVVHVLKGTQKILAIPPLCSKTKIRDDLTRLPLWVDKQC